MTKGSMKITFLATLVSILLVITLGFTFLTHDEGALLQRLTTVIPATLSGASSLFLILVLATSIGLPRQFAALSSGYIFGVVPAVVIATLAAVTGCIITVTLSRTLLRKKVSHYYREPLAKVEQFFNTDTFIKAFIIRILPVGSNFLTNVLAGSAQVNTTPYVLGSALGFLPQMTIFSMMGAGLNIADQQLLHLSGLLLVIALILAHWLYRRNGKNYNLYQ